VGTSTTKLTANLAGSANKPDMQIPATFYEGHEAGKISGIWLKTAQMLKEGLLGEGSSVAEVPSYDKPAQPVTVHDVRQMLTLVDSPRYSIQMSR